MRIVVRNFHNWNVKGVRDQIRILSHNQACITLLAIEEGRNLKEAIAIGFSYPEK